ncbi:MAG: glycosyltransferase family 2 protein [Acidobacteriota bacterium]
MKLSIGIIHWNAVDELRRCLQAFSRAQLPQPCELIVVDNASQAPTDGLVEEFSHVRWILNGFNAGFAGACNQIVDSSSGELILFCNPDIEAGGTSVMRLLEVLDGTPRAAVAAPALVDSQGRLQSRSVRRLPTISSVTSDLIFLDELRRAAPPIAPPVGPPRKIQQPAGACLMIRRTALEEVGRWDEQFYPAWFEDVDLCRRFERAGWEILWVPDSQVLHVGGQSLNTLGFHKFIALYYVNLRRYFRKHHAPAAALYVALLSRCALVLRRILVRRT